MADGGWKMKPELLAPAGNPAAFFSAVRYGADAVYLGADAFGLRAGADNFTDEELAETIAYAHERDVRVYVTANIFAHNDDIARAEEFFLRMKDLSPDALLISDPGLFSIAKRICPDVDIHISTQANNTNYETCRFWHDLGATRIVLARELTLKEIAKIRERAPKELSLECFVHGAMCMAYSGRCLLSENLAARDANRGACTHPCRWNYALVEEKRPDETFPVEENERGTFIMASKDLCMLGHLPELRAAGVDSMKIEGRMKSALYVATVTRAYRKMIDAVYADASEEEQSALYERYFDEVCACAARPLSTGFYFDDRAAGALDLRMEHETPRAPYIFVGVAETIDEKGRVKIAQRNKFSAGDTIEIMRPDGRDRKARVLRIFRADFTETDSAPHPKETLYLELDAQAEAGDVLRMRGTA